MIDADSIYTVTDSLSKVVNPASNITDTNVFSLVIDFVYKIAMVVIAACNFVYVLHFNKNNSEKNRVKYERDRRLSLFKTMILDNNLRHLYDYFNNMDAELQKLLNKNANKKEIEKNIQILTSNLEKNFTSFICAFNYELGMRVRTITDRFLDDIVSSMGNEGINLYVKGVYHDNIKKPFNDTKEKLIKTLSEYNGE